MTFQPEPLDQLLQGYTNPEDLLGIEALFPKTTVQLCIVHLVRSNALSYVSYKDRKAVVVDLRLIDTASTETEAEQ